jgi:hypothetical protein
MANLTAVARLGQGEKSMIGLCCFGLRLAGAGWFPFHLTLRFGGHAHFGLLSAHRRLSAGSRRLVWDSDLIGANGRTGPRTDVVGAHRRDTNCRGSISLAQPCNSVVELDLRPVHRGAICCKDATDLNENARGNCGKADAVHKAEIEGECHEVLRWLMDRFPGGNVSGSPDGRNPQIASAGM